jgi:3-hydroxyacyl-CoA dehydrogenase
VSRRVAVVGAGSIGVGWALVFARAGHDVALHDADPQRRAAVPDELRRRLEELAEAGLLPEPPPAVLRRVTVHDTLAAAVSGAVHVQESAPERLDVKRALFAQLDQLAPPDTVLASSSSALPASTFARDLRGRARCLVAHPANPPHLLPVVEVVPAPFSRESAVAATIELLEEAAMSPVRLACEVEGFILNRLQGAVLREAYCLVRDGVASVDDVDRVMRDGLGRRWAWIGPFETADLNVHGGIAAHAERMGPAYARMGAERGQDDPWTPQLVARVTAERRRLLPLDAWEERVAWRDRALVSLERLRREVVTQER